MKKRLAVLLAGALTAALLGGCSTGSTQSGTGSEGGEEGGDIYLTFAGGNSSTEAYTYWVAVNKAIKTQFPNLQINTVDATGGFDIAQRLRQGSIDAGNGVSTSDYESYSGTGSFEGQPFEDLRILWYYSETPINWCVDKSLGLKCRFTIHVLQLNN